MIYAVEVLDRKFVKVGFSENEDVTVRIASLQTGCPFEIKPLLDTFGTLRQEKAIHAALSVAFGRIRVPMPPNEWYPGRAPFFVDFLEHLKYGADAGLMFIEKYNPSVRQGSVKNGRGNLLPNLKWPSLGSREEFAN